MIGPNEVWELPHQHVGRRVLCFESVASTNDIPVDPGEAVLADEQTAGRGQYGRTWLARPGSSVLLSARLDPPPPLRRPALLTAWAAVSVAEAIRGITGHQATIKWPNDVLLDGRKVCGVLIEQGKSVIVGIGLNVNQAVADFAAANLPLASSLAIVTARTFNAHDVARVLLQVMDQEYDRLLRGNVPDLETNWKQYLDLMDREVTAECFDGSRYRGRLVECSFAAVELDGPAPLRLRPETIRALAASR